MAVGNQSRSVNEILDRFETEVIPTLRPRTQRSYKGTIKTLRHYFGAKVANTLTVDDFQEFMGVSKGKSHRNTMLTTFSSIFSKAVKDWHWLDHNVCPYVRRHEIKSRERHASDEDIEGVLAIASPPLQQVLRLCLLTAQNQSNLFTLKWSQVHEKEKEILFRDSVTREKISVAITPAISAVLDDCRKRAGKSDYVINTKHHKPFTDDGFRAMWQRTQRAWASAGHNRFTFYEVRARAEGKLGERGMPGAPKNTGSVIPLSLATTRGYLDRVVLQLNASYDAQLYDCCAVMCRRLLETLIIEVYEHCGRAAEVKGADGNFLMLNGLVSFFEKDTTFNVGRSGMKGLRDFKTLGDLSAHSRRFNAQKEDIDRVRDGLRVVVEELIHLAKLAPSGGS
jgi:integrase